MPPQRPVIVNPGQRTMSEQIFGDASPSVFDSGPKKVAKKVASLLGMDDPPDPASAAMDFANPIGAVIGRAAKLAPRVIRTLSGETVPRGIRAYHASPHRFDRFDINRIGSGEGAQVKGHGLYFAEHPATAETYRRDLTHGELHIPGRGRIAEPVDEFGYRLLPGLDAFETVQDHALSFITAASRRQGRGHPQSRVQFLTQQGLHPRDLTDPLDAAKWMARTSEAPPVVLNPRQAAMSDHPGAHHLARNRDDIIRQIEEWQSQGATLGRGGMTAEVNLGVRPEELLNLDRPVGAQTPEVREALQRAFDLARAKTGFVNAPTRAQGLDYLGRELPPIPLRNIPANTRAIDLIGQSPQGGMLGTDPRMVSETLEEAGIPGSTYLDQLSRPAGEGTRNIVMFDDKKIDIVKQLMLLLGIGAPAAAGAMQQEQEPRRPSMGSIR